MVTWKRFPLWFIGPLWWPIRDQRVQIRGFCVFVVSPKANRLLNKQTSICKFYGVRKSTFYALHVCIISVRCHLINRDPARYREFIMGAQGRIQDLKLGVAQIRLLLHLYLKYDIFQIRYILYLKPLYLYNIAIKIVFGKKMGGHTGL